MKKIHQRILTLFLGLFTATTTLFAGPIKGHVFDKETNEPIIGATIQVLETGIGTVTNLDGYYELDEKSNKEIHLEIRCVSYKTIKTEGLKLSNASMELDFRMESDDLTLETLVVTARKNRENEILLIQERKLSGIAVESIGAKEMSRKGVSNAADGVKKMAGISTAEAGQVIVRGLGDRYSATTLNGIPIASPNPDNKLIPLDLFQSSVIKNITVKKVYEACNYADYCGAHINIETKENIDDSFFNVSFNAGGMINALFKDFYSSDKENGLWRFSNPTAQLEGLSSTQIQNYLKSNDIFGTDFAIHNTHDLLPDFGASLNFGRNFKVGKGNIDLMASGSIKNSHEVIEDSYKATFTAQGTMLDEFTSDNYTSELDITALSNLTWHYNQTGKLNYNILYARNASDNYKFREGHDEEGIDLVGSNSVIHVYHLLNHQLNWKQKISKNWDVTANASYSSTGSNEPDRRQVMYRYTDGVLKLFSLNQQETMRYFGRLGENETVEDIKFDYRNANRKLKIDFGAAYKYKNRSFESTRFYYNTTQLQTEIEGLVDILNPNAYLSQQNIANDEIKLLMDAQPRFNYYAGSEMAAGFAEMEWNPSKNLLIGLGLRYEYMNSWVNYWNDASVEKISNLKSGDLFPALNVKYSFLKDQNLKFSASKTVTRPGFVEMAPFLYKESYGSDEIRGNENLQNGYNYNLDMRYENFFRNNDMFSMACYYKHLLNPIERVQKMAGGSAVNTFLNANSGMAAGMEIEFRKTLPAGFLMGMNASYIYTNVILPENGVYTDDNRALQGASPYMVNADLSYRHSFDESRTMQLTMLYNLQGPRIHAVGINGVSNVVQEAVNTLDFAGSYQWSEHFCLKIKMKNILNEDIKLTQKIESMAEKIVVQHHKIGVGFEIGFNYNL
jgi:Outer membrane receptor proteins, mostly Fe transport